MRHYYIPILKPPDCRRGEPPGVKGETAERAAADIVKPPDPAIHHEHEKWLETIIHLIDFF
jgi:hypothetical protein